jgi:RHS repeat-associated protein
VVTTGYDAVGNVTRTVDQLGFATTTSYDALNRPVTIQDANGLISTVSYDANSNVIARVDGLGHATTYAFDALNRQVTVLDSRGFVTTTGYDAVGNTTLVVDSDGNRTTMSFDGDNRLTQQADPFNNLSTMAYDQASRLTSTTDRDGRRRDFQYDLDNRQTTVIWNVAGNPVNTLTYSFDGAGNMLTAGDRSGTYTMTYDSLNRQVTVQGPFNTTLTLAYDAAGNRTLRQDSLGGTTTYSFDVLNRLATVQFGGASQTPLRMDLAYTARSQLATITRFSDLAGSTKIGTSAFSYDPGMRMTTLIHANSGGTPLATYAWSYDGANRLTTEKLNSNAPMTYSYDLTNQLTTVQSSYGTQTYGYDGTGNRTNTGYQTTLANEVTSDGTWTYTFDSEGIVVKKSKGASAETWTFGYDNLNHLVTAIDKSTDGGTTIAVATYSYDVFGDRLEADDWATGGTTTITRFAYDGQDVWADLTSGNTPQTRYIRGNQIDSLFARISAAGTAAWYLTDRLGSVRDLADNTGALQDHIDFDGFGKILSESNAPFGDRYKFTGREWDPVDNLQYNRARYYDPNTGRWTSQDLVGFSGGDTNLYRYVLNTPALLVDPSGLDFIAVADRPVQGAPVFYHYSLEYWETDKHGPAKPSSTGAWLASIGDAFAIRAHAVELLAYTGLKTWVWGKDKQWWIDGVKVSYIHFDDKADRLVCIYEGADAKQKWQGLHDKAAAYQYAEANGFWTSVPLKLQHWPNSLYEIPDIQGGGQANNSNVFVRWLVKQSGLKWIELPGLHPPSADTPLAIDPTRWPVPPWKPGDKVPPKPTTKPSP